MGQRIAKRVLLLGWDGADWQIIQPLLDAGRMPHLERLINDGVMGNLATLKPILSPMLWTSIATGKRADSHGVYGFIEPRADGLGVRPVSCTSLKAQTLWSILRGRGLKSAVVGWYATHPAARAGGTVVSNYFRHALGEDFEKWPFDPATVAPESLHDIMRDLRAHPKDLEFEQLKFFIPEAGRIDQEKDRRLETLARYLAECATVHAAGTWLAEQTEWDLLAVYYDTIDRLCHEFMWYRGPKMDHISEADFEIYRHVVDRTYIYHDMMLGRYLQLAGLEATVIIVSDHGFFSDHLRPLPMGKEGLPPPLRCHRPYGIFVARGPGLKRDELVFGASLLDATPTVLALLGQPVGRDMAGRVLPIFTAQADPVFIETYETAGGPEESSPAEPVEEDPWAAQEALRQLVALGYVEAPPEDAAKAVEMAENQKLANLAEVHLAKGEPKKASALLEELIRRQPQNQQAKLHLAQCRLRLGDIEACQGLVEEVFKGEQLPQALHAYGLIECSRRNWSQALKHFKEAGAKAPSLPHIQRQIGTTYLRMGKLAQAEAAFRKSLDLEGDSPATFDGLGMALYRQKKFETAEECFIRSLGCLYHQPLVHLHLGIALASQGKLTGAIESLKRTLEFNPNLKEAHKVLIKIYRKRGEEALARFHKERSRELPDRKETDEAEVE